MLPKHHFSLEKRANRIAPAFIFNNCDNRFARDVLEVPLKEVRVIFYAFLELFK